MPGLKGWRPTRIHALRALVVLGCLVVLWHTQVTEAMIVRPPAAQTRAEWWSLAAWAAHAVLLAVGLTLLWLAPQAPTPPLAKGWSVFVGRALASSFLLSLGLTLYLLVGGEDLSWFKYGYAPVGTVALFAPLLAAISLLDGQVARARGARRAVWILVCGALAGGALCLAWIQREYCNEMFLHGTTDATQHALGQAEWLSESPLWTLQYFGWVAIPVTISTWLETRPRGERAWTALALTGAALAWTRMTPFADGVIVSSSLLICTVPPVAYRWGERLQARFSDMVRG